MKSIPEVYRKNGYDYKLISRDDVTAIYAQWDNGKFVAYEVCLIRILKPREIFGKLICMHEVLPSTSKWGTDAYTVFTLEKAYIRAKELRQRHGAIKRRNIDN